MSMPTTREYEKLVPYLRGRVLITAHRHPDGDAVGSSLAMYHLVRSAGGQPVVYSYDPYGDEFAFLPGSESVVSDPELVRHENWDAIFVVDVSTSHLLGPMPSCECPWLVLDHHSSHDRYGTVEIVDPSAASVGILVEELRQTARLPLTLDFAKCVWTSIVSDTGGFRYSSTDPRAMKIGSRMLEAGVNAWEAASYLYEYNTLERMRLLSLALGTIRVNGKVGSMYVDERMLRETETSAQDTSGFVNYVRAIRNVEIAIFLRPDPDDPSIVRISLRSKGQYPVDEIGEKFGGGGHRNAAGCRYHGPIEEARRVLMETAAELVRSRDRG